MSVLVKDDVVWLEVSEDNISLVQVLQCKKHLSKVNTSTILSKPFVLLKCTTHVATRRVVKQQEKLLWCLESILEPNNEGVSRVCQHISLSLRIFNQILAQDLLFVQDFHRKEFPSLLWILSISIKSELFYQVNDSERALTKLHDGLEIFGSNRAFFFLALSLKLLVELPDLDELVFPARVTGSFTHLCLCRVIYLYLLRLCRRL